MSQQLVELLQWLQGQDIEKLSDDENAALKEEAAQRFRSASAWIPNALLAGNQDGYIWNVMPADPHALDYIASFTLMPTDLMDANIGAPDLVQMHAAFFPRFQLQVDLFGEFHYLSGMLAKPKLELSLKVSDPDCLQALACADSDSCNALVALGRGSGFEVVVQSIESGIGQTVDPSDLHAAIEIAAEAVRIEAEETARLLHSDFGIEETVEVRMTIPAEAKATAETIHQAVVLYGLLVRSCAEGTES